jgi:hypothetical protein
MAATRGRSVHKTRLNGGVVEAHAVFGEVRGRLPLMATAVRRNHPAESPADLRASA